MQCKKLKSYIVFALHVSLYVYPHKPFSSDDLIRPGATVAEDLPFHSSAPPFLKNSECRNYWKRLHMQMCLALKTHFGLARSLWSGYTILFFPFLILFPLFYSFFSLLVSNWLLLMQRFQIK